MRVDLAAYVNKQIGLARLDGSGERARFVVASALRDRAVLVPEDPASRRLAGRLQDDEVVEISAPTAHGVALSRTRVVKWSPTARMLTLVNPGPIEEDQRRAAYRVELAVPVSIAHVLDGVPKVVAGTTINVATGGVAATVDLPAFEVGSDLVALLTLDDGPILAVGSVRAQHDPPHIDLRLQFTQMAKADQHRLARLVQQLATSRVRTEDNRGPSTPR